MRVPLSWLRSLCDPGLDAQQVADLLTGSGTELERIEQVGVPAAEGFVIGKVLSADQHPDADRLRVCEVDTGDRARTIVCGAPNVAAGQTVAVALPGAVMPDGTKLGEVKLRGISSAGMILSERELGIGDDYDGIMVLADEQSAGVPLAEAFAIADQVIEVEINPNRPDCMSVYGVARELHALTGASLAEDPTGADAQPSGEDQVTDHVSVEIASPEICLRFTARAFENVAVGPSPPWLKQRLTAAGQRPISNVVDITNYVMLLTGQPLHAFDLDLVAGSQIVIRRALEGERMTTLDGVERTLDADMALVCDEKRPSGIAGVMGGQVSEVGEQTTRVLMEAATWVGPNVLRTSKRLGLRSEASARFERQLHPELAIGAQRLAAALMVELCGARLVPGTIDAYPAALPVRSATLRLERMTRLLGNEIPSEEAVGILTRLGFEASEAGGVIEVVVPPWRDGDVQREADLIEEVARIHGLDRLPATLPARRAAVGRRPRDQRLRAAAEDALRGRGLSETISYSFTSQANIDRLRIEQAPLQIANPLGEEQAVMRPTLLTGLLDAVAANLARGETDIALYEVARVFAPGTGPAPVVDASPAGATPAIERMTLGAVCSVSETGTWRSDRAAADFYGARVLVEAVLGIYGVEASIERPQPGDRPYLHPARSAVLTRGPRGPELGWVGELHPLVLRAWDLDGPGGDRPIAGFELDLDELMSAVRTVPTYAAISDFPAVRQDIAVVVAEGVAAETVLTAVRGGGGDLLESVELFDLFRGEQVGAGKKSLALALEFRAPDRTLTDEEVVARREAIATALSEIGGALRA